MSDLPYLMQDPVKDELWLVTSETRLLITPEIYDLLASNGAELPDAYGIKELREQNAKLRELVRDMWEGYYDPRCEECHLKDTPTCADCPICAREASVIDRMRELGVEVVMDERRRS